MFSFFQKEAASFLNRPFRMLKNLYPKHFFEEKFSSLEEALHHFFCKKKYTLAIAESCTGGALSASFAKQPGASFYLKGGIIAYSNDVKKIFFMFLQKLYKNKGL